MKIQSISFQSDAYWLDGSIYLPDDYHEGKPLVGIIPCSGYQGFNCFYPRLFAEPLTAAGFACLGFDYRGFAESEGEQGRVLLEEQVQDVLHAVQAALGYAHFDSTRIGLIGWGMGCANVLRAAQRDPRIQSVAVLNGFYDGLRWLKGALTREHFGAMHDEIAEDLARRAKGKRSRRVPTFRYYPLDPVTAAHVSHELEFLHNFGMAVELSFFESLLRLCQKQLVEELPEQLAVLVAHGAHNLLHPLTEAQLFFQELAHERKDFFLIEGAHNDFMYRGHDVFAHLMHKIIEFFRTSLVPS